MDENVDKTLNTTKRNLNGLPGNLALSYLNILSYSQNGKMADWLDYIAKQNKTPEIEIDILRKTVNPKEATSRHLLDSLDKLQALIKSNLKKHKIKETFITEATIRFQFPNYNKVEEKEFYCFPQIEDENGVVYKGKKKITGKASESFNPKLKKEESLAQKIKEANKK